MKNLFKVLLFSLILISILFQGVSAQEQDYAKWGTMALNAVKVQYPGSDVSEYEYLGRNIISDTETKDTFDFVVKKNATKKLVRAYVTFNPKNNQLINLQIKEIQL